MDYDSYVGPMALAAVDLVNLLTPGMQGARTHHPPPSDEAAVVIAGIFASHAGHPSRPPNTAEVVELGDWAARFRRVVALVDTGDLDGGCARLNEDLRAAGAVPTLARHHGEQWHLHFHREDAGFVDSWAAGMATGLALVLGHPPVTRLGLCTAPSCDRAYADTSRNNSRRFCSVTCQNRVKAAAYRARRT